jgi:aminoglycoside phosphotransferase (APT) family kinase protein
MNLEASLPETLRGPSTTITRIAAGLSGAGVYRVEAGGEAFVLKVAAREEPIEGWRERLRIQQLAADAGLAPSVVHVDEEQRAVMSAFVVDRSFPALYGNPQTREGALAQLGRTLRRIHDLSVPPGGEPRNPREFLARVWSGPVKDLPLPDFVGDAVQRALTEEPPAPERPPVLSHNDVNPPNLVFDGERLMLLDWDTAAPNDPFYDLAAISVFLRMDQESCLKLLAAYDGEPAPGITPRFAYNRWLVAILCGVAFLHLARQSGHGGATGQETLDSTLSLGDFYQQLRAGAVNIASGEGQWQFGLALVKESFAV